MKKRFAMSRILLAIVALAMIAAMCSVSPARAASAARAGRMDTAAPHAPAASGTPCNFVSSLKTCQSTDPTVAYTVYAYGNTANCTFVFDVTWGDGHSSTKTVVDPTDGYHLLAKHTYVAPRTYTITVTGQVTAGPCTLTSSVHTFTLAPSPTLYYWSRKSGPPGTSFNVAGKGWIPGGTVHVRLPARFHGSTTWHVNSRGRWERKFTVGDAAARKYTLRFRETSGHLLVTGRFRVLVPRTLKGRTWDGYMVSYGQRYTRVTAKWTEPRYPKARHLHHGLVSLWVGLGGNKSHLQQIGTAVGYGAHCKNGNHKTPYYAWWETVPHKPNCAVLIKKPVKPGDKFRASVTYRHGSYTLKLTDITQRWTFPKVIHQKYDTNSAEVVMESPGANWPSSALSPVKFSGIKVNGASVQNPTPVTEEGFISNSSLSPFRNGSFTAYPGRGSQPGL